MGNLVQSLVPSSKTSLLPALVRNDRHAINRHLDQFKQQGLVKHERTLLIPTSERIPALTRSEEGYEQVYVILVASLQRTMNNLNLRKGMNEDQLLELADLIIEESREDNLSMEDVLLFLQQLTTGKAGKIFDRMDMPVFFELFEHYRQARYLALRYVQYEAEVNYKAMGDTTRISDSHAENDDNTRQVMADYYKQRMNNVQSEPIQPPSAA